MKNTCRVREWTRTPRTEKTTRENKPHNVREFVSTVDACRRIFYDSLYKYMYSDTHVEYAILYSTRTCEPQQPHAVRVHAIDEWYWHLFIWMDQTIDAIEIFNPSHRQSLTKYFGIIWMQMGFSHCLFHFDGIFFLSLSLSFIVRSIDCGISHNVANNSNKWFIGIFMDMCDNDECAICPECVVNWVINNFFLIFERLIIDYTRRFFGLMWQEGQMIF